MCLCCIQITVFGSQDNFMKIFWPIAKRACFVQVSAGNFAEAVGKLLEPVQLDEFRWESSLCDEGLNACYYQVAMSFNYDPLPLQRGISQNFGQSRLRSRMQVNFRLLNIDKLPGFSKMERDH